MADGTNLPKLSWDSISLVMDLRKVDKLRQVLQRSRELCNKLLVSGGPSFSEASPPDLGVQLVLDDDCYGALLNHQRVGVRNSAEALRTLAQKLQVPWACLPPELQHQILSYVVVHPEPIVEFGALYTNPRFLSWVRPLRRERLNHLAVSQVCRDFRAYKRFYMEQNTFAFADAMGLTCFLQRVGYDQHENVKSIMALSPALGGLGVYRDIPKMSPEKVMIPLFTSLRSLTLVDAIMHSSHGKVAATINYLYKIASLRPSLQEVQVVEFPSVPWARCLYNGTVIMCLPQQIELDRRALRVGLARLNVDLKRPVTERYNRYFYGWFERSFLRKFLGIMGGQASFPAVWRQPGGTPPRTRPQRRLRDAWGAWALAASRKQQGAINPPSGGATDCQTFWPATLGPAYAAAEAAANAPRDTDPVALVAPLTPHERASRNVCFAKLVLRPDQRPQAAERWPGGRALGPARGPHERWLTMGWAAALAAHLYVGTVRAPGRYLGQDAENADIDDALLGYDRMNSHDIDPGTGHEYRVDHLLFF